MKIIETLQIGANGIEINGEEFEFAISADSISVQQIHSDGLSLVTLSLFANRVSIMHLGLDVETVTTVTQQRDFVPSGMSAEAALRQLRPAQ